MEFNNNAELKVDFGELQSNFGRVGFKFQLESNGYGRIQIISSNEKYNKMTITELDKYNFMKLKEIVSKIDEFINKLTEENKLKSLESRF